MYLLYIVSSGSILPGRASITSVVVDFGFLITYLSLGVVP